MVDNAVLEVERIEKCIAFKRWENGVDLDKNVSHLTMCRNVMACVWVSSLPSGFVFFLLILDNLGKMQMVYSK